MSDFSILYPLAGFTLVAALAIVAWQRARARRALRNKEESAMAHPERR